VFILYFDAKTYSVGDEHETDDIAA